MIFSMSVTSSTLALIPIAFTASSAFLVRVAHLLQQPVPFRNKVNLIIPADAKQMSRPWLTIPVAKDRIYFNICMIKFFLDIISPSNDFKNKLHTLFSKFPLSFDSINYIKLWFFLRTGKFLYKIEKFMNL